MEGVHIQFFAQHMTTDVVKENDTYKFTSFCGHKLSYVKASLAQTVVYHSKPFFYYFALLRRVSVSY
jgi:hypothetical protein